MNFAPYQDESPEVERALSPTLGDPNRSKSPGLQSPRVSPPAPGFAPSHHAPPNQYGGQQDLEGGRLHLAAFNTSLPIRMDIEAMLAYLLLPPAGGVFLLLVEHDSDYVRFHAWQSAMLFTALFVSVVLRVGVEPLSNICAGNSSHSLIFELPILDSICLRPRFNCLPELACLSRW